jgi:predicted transposase YdaD
MSTKPYDQAFKFLAEADAEGLLLLLGDIQPGEGAQIEPLPREISVSAQLPDQPYKVTIDGKSHLVHVEAQTVYDSGISERMLEYGVRLWLKYRLPQTSYLLLLTDRKVPRKVPRTASVTAHSIRIKISYIPVCLWRMSAAKALSLNRESLLPFISLMSGGRKAMETGARRLADVPSGTRRQELSLHFLLLGGLRYNRDDLLDLIGRATMIPIDQLKDSSFYQYILDEGREEGREEGRVLGRNEGQASLLRRQLEHRFGELPEWVSRKIEAADCEKLEGWALRWADAKSLEEVFEEA